MCTDPDASIFITDPKDANNKTYFFKEFFLHITRYFYTSILHHFSKKRNPKNHKTVEMNVFLTIFA